MLSFFPRDPPADWPFPNYLHPDSFDQFGLSAPIDLAWKVLMSLLSEATNLIEAKWEGEKSDLTVGICFTGLGSIASIQSISGFRDRHFMAFDFVKISSALTDAEALELVNVQNTPLERSAATAIAMRLLLLFIATHEVIHIISAHHGIIRKNGRSPESVRATEFWADNAGMTGVSMLLGMILYSKDGDAYENFNPYACGLLFGELLAAELMNADRSRRKASPYPSASERHCCRTRR